MTRTSTLQTSRRVPHGASLVSRTAKLVRSHLFCSLTRTVGFGNFNKYGYEHEGGTGVNAYIIDTGVNIKHVEFQGRAFWGKTIPAGASDFDGNGHGTHVAGTVGSKTYGVAKNVTIWAVKVLGDGGSGTMADVVGGVDWATKNATTGANKGKRSVANMSLGGGKSPSLDLAVDTAVEAGLHFAVAAGNDNRDACTFSPAASVNAVTVGASTIGDEKATFSNHGSCVDGAFEELVVTNACSLRAWSQHQVDLEHGRRGDQRHLRHQHGQPARCRSARLLPQHLSDFLLALR